MPDSRTSTNEELLLTHAKGLVAVLMQILKREGVGYEMANLQRGARFLTVPLLLADDRHIRPVIALAQNFANRTNSANVIVEMQRKWIAVEFELPDYLWQAYTRADLTARPGTTCIGVGLGQKMFQVDIDWSMVPHALVGGSTRIAGKSTTVESILVGLMTQLTPEQLKVIIVDPHNDYNRLGRAKHLACPIANTPLEATQAIDLAMGILRHRQNHQIKVGDPACFPVFLVIDEAKTIIPQANRIAEVVELAQAWGKYGGHLIISSQKLTDGDLPGIMVNLGWRIIGQVPGKRDATFLSGEQDSNCQDLSGTGDFKIFNGALKRRVQVAMVSDADLLLLDQHPTAPEWGAPVAPTVAVSATPLSSQPVGKQIDYAALLKSAPLRTPSKGGRPTIQVDPVLVARYIVARSKGQPITADQAEKYFGLHRTGHELNRDFPAMVNKEIKRLTR